MRFHSKPKAARFLPALCFFSFLLACASPQLEELRLSSPEGMTKASFRVELARDGAARAQGLMYRREMPQGQGMLFLFSEDGTSPFWMKNTLIPLDIIFIDSQKRIVNIVARAIPQTETLREPAGPYRYVLEINGGLAEKWGIQAGDRVDFPLK